MGSNWSNYHCCKKKNKLNSSNNNNNQRVVDDGEWMEPILPVVSLPTTVNVNVAATNDKKNGRGAAGNIKQRNVQAMNNPIQLFPLD